MVFKNVLRWCRAIWQAHHTCDFTKIRIISVLVYTFNSWPTTCQNRFRTSPSYASTLAPSSSNDRRFFQQSYPEVFAKRTLRRLTKRTLASLGSSTTTWAAFACHTMFQFSRLKIRSVVRQVILYFYLLPFYFRSRFNIFIICLQEVFNIVWGAEGPFATVHYCTVLAQIILLTYGPPSTSSASIEQFHQLFQIWYPSEGQDMPRAYSAESSDELDLIPDWLKLRMIRSEVKFECDKVLLPSQVNSSRV